jgi:hypothetical protein
MSEKEPNVRFFETWEGPLSLSILYAELMKFCSDPALFDKRYEALRVTQKARDIIELLLMDDITYDPKIQLYSAKQVENAKPHKI